MIEKTYQPNEVETRIYQTWEAAQAFRAGRPERLVARPFHHGRGAVEGRAQGLRPALSREPDLQGQAPRELGPQAADRHLGPGSSAGRGQRVAVAHQVPDRGR